MAKDSNGRLREFPFSTIRDINGVVVFRDPDMSESQQHEVGARTIAWRIYNDDGDDSYLRALGVLPEADDES